MPRGASSAVPSFRRWVRAALVVGALLLSAAEMALSQQSTANVAIEQVYRTWADQQRAVIQERLRKWDTAILQARQALDRANGLQSASSAAARDVAARALTIADTALQRALAGRARDADQLKALDRMLDPLVLQLAAASKRGDDVVISSRMIGEGIFIQSKTSTGRKKLGEGAIKLQPGDLIETGADSINVMLADGSWIAIGPHSNLIYDPETGFEVLAGKVHRTINCMRKRFLNGRAPCGVIKAGPYLGSVRGTEYTVEAIENEGTSIKVFEGTLDFRDSRGASVAASAGQQVHILRDGAVRGPTPLDIGSEPRWWEN